MNYNSNDNLLSNRTLRRYDSSLLLEPDDFDNYLTLPNDSNIDLPNYDMMI